MAPTSAELATAYVSVALSTGGMGADLKKKLGAAGDASGKEAGDRAGSAFSSHLGSFLKKSLVGVGVTAGVALGGVIVKGFGDAFAQSDATTKFKQSLDFAGITKGQIDQATKITQKYADDTVFDLSTVQNTAAQLAANGVKDFTGLTMAAGNLNAVAGGNADTFRGVAMALTQTVGAGKLTTENWNQIADAIPGASGVLQAALKKNGAFTGDFRDAMAKGQITATEFNKALMQVGNRPIAKQAATSTATFEGAMGNLMATITGGFARLLNNVKPQLTAIIGAISTGFTKGFSVIKNVFGFIGDHSKIFGTLAAVIGTVVGAWALWTGAIKAWEIATKIATAVQVAFNAVMNANPVMLVVTAIAALAAGFAYLWTHSKSFRDFWIGLWDKIKSVVSTVVDWFKDLPDTIGRIFTSVIDWFEDLPGKIWGGVKSGAKWLTTTAGDLIGWILTGIKNVASDVWDWFKGLPGKAWAGVKALSSTIVGYGTSLLTWIWNGIKGIAGKVWGWFTGIPTSIWNVIKGLGARLGTSGRQVLSFIWDGIKGLASSVWNWFTGIPSHIWGAIKGLGSTISGYGGKVIGWVWSGIKSGAGAIWTWFGGMASNIWNKGIKPTWDRILGFGKLIIGHIGAGIKSFASGIWDTVKGIGGWIWTGIKKVWDDILGYGKSILNRIGDGITAVASTIGTAVSGAVKSALNAAITVVNTIIHGFNAATHGLSHVWSWAGIPAIPGIPDIPKFKAKGGRVEAGKPYIVGELRPELFVPDRSGTILPRVPDTGRSGPLIGTVNITERLNPAQLAAELDRRMAFRAAI